MEPNHCDSFCAVGSAGSDPFIRMIYETPRRSLVKTVIYRIWVLFTTYIMLLITGETLESALLPTLVINAIWMTSFYVYDRIWARIAWGRL